MHNGETLIFFLRILVIVLFVTINIQLVQLYLLTRFPDYLILFFRFLSAVAVLLLINQLYNVALVKIFYCVTLLVYFSLVLFARRLSPDGFSKVLLAIWLCLSIMVVLWVPIYEYQYLFQFPINGVDFAMLSVDYGIVLGDTVLFSMVYPWPIMFYRLIVDVYMILKIVTVKEESTDASLAREAKAVWIGHFIFTLAFDLMILFFFPYTAVRLAINVVGISLIVWMVWARPHWIILTKIQLMSLYDKVQYVVKRTQTPKIPAVLVRTSELNEYFRKVERILKNDNGQ